MKNQIVFQTNITEINSMEKIIGIGNVNCSSLALTVFLSFQPKKTLSTTLLSEFTIKIEFYY